MIAIANIIKQARIDLKDMNEVQYSDWDMENAINKVLRLTANHFSMLNADFTEKQKLMLDSPLKLHFKPPTSKQIAKELHGDHLPIDFVAVVRVTRPDGYELSPATGHINPWNYQIYRQCIFALGPIILRYRRTFVNMSKDDSVELPISFFDFLVEATKIALAEKTSVLTEFITDNAMKMIPGRRYSNARQRLPWRI